MPEIIPTTEPFFFPGNQVGCLLIHGFTGTPKEMRWMGEYLNRQGFSALGVRLTGHATHVDDLIHTQYTDWLGCVEDGYRLLSGTVERIYLLGLSMGGVLALTAASYLPVQGVVAMATPYKLPDDWRLNFIDLFARVRPYTPKSKDPPGSEWFDQEAYRDHISYLQQPTRSVGELNKLCAKMRAALPQVNAPVLLIHSRDDISVLPPNMPAIHADLGSADKSMQWIEKSAHPITRDAQRETVFKMAADFIRRVEAA